MDHRRRITKKGINKLYRDTYKRTISADTQRRMLETLETLGFLEIEADPNDKRKKVYTVSRVGA